MVVTPYTLRSMTRARNAASRLREVMGELGLEVPKLSAAQETVARLMGHGSWSALARQVAQAPEEGVEDCDLGIITEERQARRAHQIRTLAERHSAGGINAEAILDHVKPTGRQPQRSPSIREHLLPSLYRLGLRLSAEDLKLREDVLRPLREFDTAARALMRLVPIEQLRYDALAANHDIAKIIRGRAAHGGGRLSLPMEDELWQAALEPQRLERARQLDAVAWNAARRSWDAVSQLGAAPYLAPVDRFTLRLARELGPTEWGESRNFRNPLEREPWVQLDHDVSLFPGHDLEWEASRWLDLRIGARRAFLDAGWRPEGAVWMVSFRAARGEIETMPVLASTPAAAVAWTAAARIAACRMAYPDYIPSIRIVRIEGRGGACDVAQAVAGALESSIWNSLLIGAARLTADARPREKPAAVWRETLHEGRRAVVWRDVVRRWKEEEMFTILPEASGAAPVSQTNLGRTKGWRQQQGAEKSVTA